MLKQMIRWTHAIMLALIVLVGMASNMALAQTGSSRTGGQGDTTGNTNAGTGTSERGSNWGWIGLAGLLGLLALIPRSQNGHHATGNNTGAHMGSTTQANR